MVSNQRTTVNLVLFFLLTFTHSGLAQEKQSTDSFLSWSYLPDLPPAPGEVFQPGLAGAFTGISNDALIIAGGANFPAPVWENDKIYHDDIYVLVKTDPAVEKSSPGSHFRWIKASPLNHPIAYGASVSTDHGVVCMGGNDSQRVYDHVFLLKWDPETESVQTEMLPRLPLPCTNGSAAVIGNTIYLAGGQQGLGLETALNNFWSLDLSQTRDNEWKKLPPWPAPARALNITVAQHNGYTDCIYLIGGRRLVGDPEKGNYEFLKDVYEFNPSRYEAAFAEDMEYNSDAHPNPSPWRVRAEVPSYVMAGTGIALGQSHILIPGGADGSFFYRVDELKDNHPGFPKKAFLYHTITNTWIPTSPPPENQVTTRAVQWENRIVIPSGEIRPRVRSPRILAAREVTNKKPFGTVNFMVLVIYLMGMVGVGVYFMRRNKDTNDFFRGGQRIPWWVAGCSIFATMLSSITYMAIPAKAYATDWTYLLSYPPIFITAAFVVYFILPFFRRIDATSAYEYLEKRFNLVARLIGSSLFVMFQIGRMAIVMFLSALALAAITPLTEPQCILIMGVLSIIYCTLGGIEAVVWTDTIQTFVLLGGALLILVIILVNLEGGISTFFTIATADHKLHTIQWNWDKQSYMTTAFWVVFFGALGQNLVSYTSDHAVVQRYLTTRDERAAAKAIWTNGIMSLFAGLLFFSLGAALFVFYKTHPSHLDPVFRTDAIMPLFIVREIPVGLAGLIVAGIFAAAQSTISTSMNSTATAIVTDFFRRFHLVGSEKAYLNLARWMTILLGSAGTAFALLFVKSDVKSLFDSFISIIGLFGGSLAGLFLLGMFTRRAHGVGAVVGVIAGAVVLYLVKMHTQTHIFLYALVGIFTCMLVGYLVSLLIPGKLHPIEGLTIYSLKRTRD